MIPHSIFNNFLSLNLWSKCFGLTVLKVAYSVHFRLYMSEIMKTQKHDKCMIFYTIWNDSSKQQFFSKRTIFYHCLIYCYLYQFKQIQLIFHIQNHCHHHFVGPLFDWIMKFFRLNISGDELKSTNRKYLFDFCWKTESESPTYTYSDHDLCPTIHFDFDLNINVCDKQTHTPANQQNDHTFEAKSERNQVKKSRSCCVNFSFNGVMDSRREHKKMLLILNTR